MTRSRLGLLLHTQTLRLVALLWLLPVLAWGQSAEFNLSQFAHLQAGPGGNLNALATGNRFQPTANIQRLNDRVFIGGATKNDGLFPPVALDWLSAYEDTVGYTNFTLFGKLNVLGDMNSGDSVGITTGCRSFTFTNPGQACIGLESFAICNNLSVNANCWGLYAEAHRRQPGVQVYALEVDNHNGCTGCNDAVPTPYRQAGSIGIQDADGAGVGGCTASASSVSGTVLTIGGTLTCQLGHTVTVGDNIYCVGCWSPGQTPVTITSFGTGSGGLGTYNISTNLGSISAEFLTESNDLASGAAFQCWSNIVPWNACISIGQYALAGCDGVNNTVTCDAIALATSHAIEWFNASNAETAQLSSSVLTASNGTKITYTDSGLQISDIGGGQLALFPAVASAGNSFTFTAAAAGSTAIISTNNGNLKLQANGANPVVSGSQFNTLAGINATGGTVALNPSSNFNTTINTGTSTGTIQIGNSSNTGLTSLLGLSTGTAADVLCLTAGGVVILQAAGSCTISSKRFKNHISLWSGDALSELDQLEVDAFQMNDDHNRDPNATHPQIGLIAENVAKVEPRCAIYENDMETPKGYRPECVTALLVSASQEFHRKSKEQFALIYALLAVCGVLSIHGAHLHLRVRRLAS